MLPALLLACFQSFGQDKFVVELKPEVIYFQKREFYIDSVIDRRDIKVNIGMAQVGMNNRAVEAVFDEPFEPRLTKYLKEVTPKRVNQQRIVAIVNEFQVSEKTYKMKERGSADIDITFCKLDSGRLMAIRTMHEMQESGGGDVTKEHALRVAAGLKKILMDFNDSGWQTVPVTELTLDPQFVAGDSEHDILRCREKVAGVYEKFIQLRSNRPISQPVTMVGKKQYFVVRDSTSEKKLKEPFGICDGKDVFLNTKFYNARGATGVFVKVMELGHYTYWLDAYSSPMGGGTSGGFGLVGALIASVPDLMVLDMKTGIIKPILNMKKMEALFEDDPVLLEKFRKTPNNHLHSVMMSFIKSYNNAHPL